MNDFISIKFLKYLKQITFVILLQFNKKNLLEIIKGKRKFQISIIRKQCLDSAKVFSSLWIKKKKNLQKENFQDLNKEKTKIILFLKLLVLKRYFAINIEIVIRNSHTLLQKI